MSTSREDRAMELLRIGELAARNMCMDINDTDDPHIRSVMDSFGAFTSKVRYLRHRASARWSDAFEKVIDTSHSMRIERLASGKNKEDMRPVWQKCMACGQLEYNCRYSIDFAGFFDAPMWLKGVDSVREQYAEFVKEYETCFTDDFIEDSCKEHELPAVDKGSYIVGETCLRKAKLRYLIQTAMLEICCEAERNLESLTESEGRHTFDRDTFYTLSDNKAEFLVKRQDAIDLAIADERRKAPDLAMDHSFWEIIDRIRSSVAKGDDEAFHDMIRNRANGTLDSMRKTIRSPKPSTRKDETDDELVCSECSNDEAEEGDCGGPSFSARSNGVRVARMRCIIDDDEEEGQKCGKQRGAYMHTRSMTRAKRKRRVVTVEEEEEEEEEEEGEEAEEENQQQHPPSVRLSSRAPTASISKMVAMQRASGVLPSRRVALRSLMELQMRLAQQDRHTDSAICTNAIQTLQELMDRVEHLAHTNGI